MRNDKRVYKDMTYYGVREWDEYSSSYQSYYISQGGRVLSVFTSQRDGESISPVLRYQNKDGHYYVDLNGTDVILTQELVDRCMVQNPEPIPSDEDIFPLKPFVTVAQRRGG